MMFPQMASAISAASVAGAEVALIVVIYRWHATFKICHPWQSMTIAEPCLRAWDPPLIVPGDIGLSKRGREIGGAVRAVDRSLGARRPSIPRSVQPSSHKPIPAVALLPGHPLADLRAASTGFRRNTGTMATRSARQSSDGNSLHVGAQGKRKRRRSKIDGAIRSGWLRSVRRS